MKIKAFLFDLNGTMINDMPYHITAWHSLLNKLGADLTYERVKEECYGKNSELLDRIFPGRFSDKEKDEMSMEKERGYQSAYLPELKLINGLGEFLEISHVSGIRMAIASAAILFNIDYVLDNLNIRKYFDAIVSAESVKLSKPDPETYLMAARLLNYEPSECLVFEDTPKGVEAANNAGMKAVVITTLHHPGEFVSYPNVIGYADDFTTVPGLIKKENSFIQVS